MAHLLGAENLSISFGTRTILDGVSLGLEEGDRIGMVGRNGDGKSTLMSLLAERQTPDDGRVTRRRDVTVGYLDQTDVLDGDLTVGQAIVGDAADYEWASNARIRDVMSGLVQEVDWNAQVSSLSGGQKRRVALAKLLTGDDDVIMLDEPTNHLDVEGVAWLARHLKQRWRPTDGGLLVVTHDRWFLDEICTRTWEVHDAVVDPFDGGYAAYVLARAERDRMASVVENKRQQLVKKELAWLRRGAPARTAKPKFRIEAANNLIEDVPEPRDTLSLNKMATARLGKDVLDLENVSLTLGNTDLFRNITLRLAPGERLGLVGVNGAGKTTLLRLLNGEIEPTAGRLKRGKTVQTAVLTQEVKELDEVADQRVIEVIENEKRVFNVGGRELSAGQLVEQLGFSAQRQWTPVRELSGGERRRLQLLRLLVGEPNVLMLDEPTNDLDTDTLAAVEDVLDGWPGTLVVVSHDRYLLERVTDHQMALLGDGKLRGLPGGVDQYLELRNETLAANSSASTAARGSSQAARAAAAGASRPGGSTGGSGTTTALAGSGASEAEKRAAKKDLARIERQLSKLTAQAEKINAQMNEATQQSGGADFELIGGLNAKLQAVAAEQEELEMQWLEASELLE
ncbi:MULTISPECIES: ABC-F family ATP-binding cassette domain-containing protein [unclassified Arthrobacter]|uniref:ABC-F family ATP-binding cassette domain-containing protein n=1 Tax=unclassified Arthrobacter TaxID=235627 RepID=UPI001D13A100|nr:MULTISPECIES: ABC-F family ATP-binding cassette domain-containing protein [unclassified Arthrobacter]MCC3277217.1 ABC-F family ATP-binding cassette domain-containing protein [Arthrobacter sp. zg-Y20]MCC3280158.1 ABC-F family ATP-binding cassette domain-containing protein [Arthrobacter sp. zg-Y40]MCC9179038.1 ABC-F family ATP-binding cassette domain-containing protein [Arthrobacter sp. zg-Y750]MDK1317377.1 ABC-F family ATP-binding cassette domain-containing protein [Arthrobacter sp. zg.Y20]W